MLRQRLGLPTERRDRQPEGSLTVFCFLARKRNRHRVNAIGLPLLVVRLCTSATSRPYAEICAVIVFYLPVMLKYGVCVGSKGHLLVQCWFNF